MKTVGEQIFSFSGQGPRSALPKLSHERCLATSLKLPETWLRDAIFNSPEIVIGPCRAAGLTDDEWYPVATEFQMPAGKIDVLLVSAEGRLAIVETKLASNAEKRREVLAQALDYLSHLPDAIGKIASKLPQVDGEPVADLDDIHDTLAQGDVLVIIACDEVDSRVAKLSRAMLARNFNSQWDLALVDVAIYESKSVPAGNHLLVSSIRGTLVSEARQTVRVEIVGDKTRVSFDAEPEIGDDSTSARQRWNEKLYFESLTGRGASKEVQKLAKDLHDLGALYPGSVTFNWGTGKKGTMVLKRNGGGLIEVRASGRLRFRPNKFGRALGEEGAGEYRRGLEKLAPSAMAMAYPLVPEVEAAKIASSVYNLLKVALEKAEGAGSSK